MGTLRLVYLLSLCFQVFSSSLEKVAVQEESAQLKPRGHLFQSRFGYDVDICGKHIVVGSPFVYLGRNRHSGSAAIFKFNGSAWNRAAFLRPPRSGSARITDGFGISVAISNIFAAVSSPYEYHDRDNSGSVYIYKLNDHGWKLDGRITSDDRGFRFGHTVALDRDVVAVGSPVLGHSGSASTGAVFVFINTRDGWKEQVRLTPPASTSAMPIRYYGAAIAMHLERIVVHGFQLERNGEYSSLVFVYRHSEGKWWMEALLKPTLSEDAGRLYPNLAHSISRNKRRVSLDINHHQIVIGTPYEDGFAGAVFVYRRTGTDWKPTSKLQPRNTWMFGDSVSVDGDFIAVGTVSNEIAETPVSTVYIYRLIDDGWWLVEILKASDGGRNVANTDSRVVLNNGRLVAGSFNKRDQLMAGNGPVYYFRLPYKQHAEDC